MKNVKLILAYDGTNYLGWQKTSTGPSIEQELENAIEKILQTKVVLQAASRTDAGVHAHGQVVNFFTTKTNLIEEKLRIGINALLPKNIVVRSIQYTTNEFHPTLDSIGKEYHYSLCYGPFQYPQFRDFSWHCPGALNLIEMRKAVECIVGIRDFSAFTNSKKNEIYENTIREVRAIHIDADALIENRLQIKVIGNHFLYKMVRNIVGTLIYVGKNKLSVEDIPLIISSLDRTKAGVTAPAHGLSLHQVFYQ